MLSLYESPVLRRFASVDLGHAAAPDETTIFRFRRLLETHELCGQILARSIIIWAARAFAFRPAPSWMRQSSLHPVRRRTASRSVTRRCIRRRKATSGISVPGRTSRFEEESRVAAGSLGADQSLPAPQTAGIARRVVSPKTGKQPPEICNSAAKTRLIHYKERKLLVQQSLSLIVQQPMPSAVLPQNSHLDKAGLYGGLSVLVAAQVERGRRKHRVDYRHVIDWLVRKPGAFGNYWYRDELFPNSQ